MSQAIVSAPSLAAAPVEARNLTRSFGSILAVDDLSFRVERGEVVGLLGPNGAGKTTTLRMLIGSLVPTSGKVLLSGFDVLREGPQARARLGYMPEQTPLYGEMTVVSYLRFLASVKGISSAELPGALERARDRLDLATVWDRPTRSLSRGFRQRVGLAQALLGDPELLVLDEPTAGLDPNQIREFRTLLRQLGRDHAILLSTHILPEAIEICDRVMIIHRGRLVAMDRPDRLTEQEARGRVVARLRCPVRPDPGDRDAQVRAEAAEIWRIEAVWDAAQGRASLARLLEQGATLLEWRTGSGGLEETFRRLTMGEGEA